MKAIVHHEYGSPDVLKLEEVEKPFPKDHEVLIKIHAVSLNGSDWEGLTGKPLYARLGGLFKPREGKKIQADFYDQIDNATFTRSIWNSVA